MVSSHCSVLYIKWLLLLSVVGVCQHYYCGTIHIPPSTNSKEDLFSMGPSAHHGSFNHSNLKTVLLKSASACQLCKGWTFWIWIIQTPETHTRLHPATALAAQTMKRYYEVICVSSQVLPRNITWPPGPQAMSFPLPFHLALWHMGNTNVRMLSSPRSSYWSWAPLACRPPFGFWTFSQRDPRQYASRIAP